MDQKFGLISLDQQKAFDQVEHQYLWNVHEAFGFSPGFVTMTKTFSSKVNWDKSTAMLVDGRIEPKAT